MRSIALISLALSLSTTIAQNAAFDPTLITRFPNGHYFNDPFAVVIQPDDKILISGHFTTYDDLPRGSIVRVNPDGSIDPTFTPGSGAEMYFSDGSHSPGYLYGMALQPDGKILIVGVFDKYDGVVRNCIARLNPDGTLDPSFDVPPSSTDTYRHMHGVHVRPDGKIWVWGGFSNIGSPAVSNIALLNADGSCDMSFDPPDFSYSDQPGVFHVAFQPDGKLLFSSPGRMALTVDPETNEFLTWMSFGRLLPSGAVDPTFDALDHTDYPVTEYDELIHVNDIEVLPDGKILIAARTNNTASTNSWEEYGRVLRLNPDGSRDNLYVPAPMFLSVEDGNAEYGGIEDILSTPDGNFVVSGWFNRVNGHNRSGIVKLKANGSVDTDFLPGAGFQENPPFGGPDAMALQGDGRIVGVGSFDSYHGYPSRGLVRIGSNSFVRLFTDVFLEGTYQPNFPGLQRSDLYPAGMLPLEEPYSGMDFSQMGSGGEHISSNTFNSQSNNQPVDWVMLELRSPQIPTEVVATRNAILLNNGHVVDTDGLSSVAFYGMSPGPYYVSVKHRNHLGAMTAQPVYVDYSGSFLDFSSPNVLLYGQSAMKEVNGVRMLWAGDINHDGELKYTGQSNDRDHILVNVGSTTPNHSVTGYKLEDVNLDGVVKYTGQDNDRDPILVNVGSSTPNNVRQAQLP